MLTIVWTKIFPDADYSEQRGVDAEGNQYWMNASQECVIYTLVDGRSGQVWTPKEAKHNAENQ